MAAEEDDELDDILESALDDFDALPPAPPVSEASSRADETGAGEVNTRAETEARRAFDEALKTLNKLNMDAGGLEREGADGRNEREDRGEVDLKLVEDFMKTLAQVGTEDAEEESGGQSGAPTGSNGGEQGITGNFEGMIESIVGQLLSKEIFRGPMLQMRDAYAAWIPENQGKVDQKDMERYERQRGLVVEICKEYEGEGNFERVMALLEKMQDCGAPPADIMKELSATEGLDGSSTALDDVDDHEALPPGLEKLNEQCKMQ